MRLRAALMLGVVLVAASVAARAQAGPPFRTDDPETPGNRHWEINYGFTGDRNPYEGYYQVPDFDINYGLGDRIQLKYELPVAIHELRGGVDNGGVYHTAGIEGGLGESLLGVKWRFYQHVKKKAKEEAQATGARTGEQTMERVPGPGALPGNAPAGESEAQPNFSLGTYPQLSLNNPTTSVRRGVVLPGPAFLLPLEANARIGWLRVDGEVGYWFTNKNTPEQWIRGLIAGHEFTKKNEEYLELYDVQDANRVDGAAKQREATLGIGGRQSLNHDNNVLAMYMYGRSFQTVKSDNGQPSWIAYVGIQWLLGPKEK
jgi:hypothetical protein